MPDEMDFSKKACEDMATSLLENEVRLLEDTNRDIIRLERIQDNLLASAKADEDATVYDLQEEDRKKAHKEVSNLIRTIYEARTYTESRVMAKILEIAECEKGK